MILKSKTQKIGADGTTKFEFVNNATRFLVKNLTSYGITITLGDDTIANGCYIPSGFAQLIVCADNNENAHPGANVVVAHGVQEDTRILGVEVQAISFNSDVSIPSQIATITAFKEIATAAIAGVTAPVKGADAVTTITATDEYTATIAWSPALASGKFEAAKVYTATITLTPKAGYSTFGVDKDFFTVTGASTVTNSVNSGVVTAVFPATAA